MSVSILDYGMANLRSVQKAFERVGVSAKIIATPAEVDAAQRLVLPGVGAVADALGHIRAAELEEPILQHIRDKRPFLGICLGLQMLMTDCHEGGHHRGLGVIEGDCVRFAVDQTHDLKVPHMGWNQVQVVSGESPLLRGLAAGSSVYFVHSYHVRPSDTAWIAATTEYGLPFVSVIARGNLTAVQFHPEKSQQVGLAMLARFARA